MKHTQGEWKVSPLSIHKNGQGNRWMKHIIISSPPATMIADVYGNIKEETEANAELIAAAPELLNVLTGFINALSHLQTNNIPDKLWDKAQSAIAKATGQLQPINS